MGIRTCVKCTSRIKSMFAKDSRMLKITSCDIFPNTNEQYRERGKTNFNFFLLGKTTAHTLKSDLPRFNKKAEYKSYKVVQAVMKSSILPCRLGGSKRR